MVIIFQFFIQLHEIIHSLLSNLSLLFMHLYFSSCFSLFYSAEKPNFLEEVNIFFLQGLFLETRHPLLILDRKCM